MSVRGAVSSGVSTVAGVTGVSWGTVMAVTLMLAFLLYIASNGSLVKYKQLLF